MKIRSGFVSNSSSSSFIVAFARKPQSEKETFEVLFGNDVDGVIQPYDFCGKLPNKRAAEIVFNDLKGKKKAKKSELINEFESRYFYFSNDDKPYYPTEKYCSTNHPLMLKMRDVERDAEKLEKEYEAQLDAMVKSAGIVEVPYASNGGIKNWNTKETFTPEDIKAYADYVEKLEKFTLTNKEYIALKKKRDESIHTRFKLVSEYRKKLAEIDVDEFCKDNEGKYIAVLTYSDNDGTEQSNMEHGGVFRNITHIQFSHH